MEENAKYNPKKIEAKWQKFWLEKGTYKNYEREKKFYVLDMFPYPSGAGLHVGHPKGYIATDTVARFKMLQGYSVLHPMGWDAFGLPAENFAIKNKTNPNIFTAQSVAVFKKQLETFGFTYDWDREINTTDPGFYKWTQWIFLKLFEEGLAYESNEPINWCPSCKTGLSNEDLEDGKCERCGSEVEQKPMRQWVLKMTAYADRLLTDLDTEGLDWEEMIVEQQRNWIGRSEGATAKFQIVPSPVRSTGHPLPSTGEEEYIEVFTTRVDTIFGCTYCVVAPEHKIIQELKDQIENYAEIEEYVAKANKKTSLERTELQKEKTGVEIKGAKVINPFNQEELPLFVADYVIGGYGTGAVMAVPAHDERDFEFAKKYDLEIRQSIAPFNSETGDDAPREEKETVRRKASVAIVKHWERDEILCLDWEKFNWKSFVIGGREEGESGEEAAIRETKEETGYQNIKSIKKIGGEIHSNFYAAHKGINRYGEFECYYVELKDGEYIEPKEEDVKNHKAVWVPEKEVSDFINLKNHTCFWEVFKNGEKATIEDGVLVNSEKYSGLTSEEAREKMTVWLEENKIGEKKINYKMRDWVFSRQRYWGEPIPIVHCAKCGAVAVPEEELPVKLPEVENYEPTGTGESPLAAITDWVNTTCPKCGGLGKRETNTMPQWAGSSWYYLRFIDPKNKTALVDKSLEKAWMPVDLYVGGAEHATRHLLYARFWHKFLFDIGAVSTTEPFKKLVHVGLILAEDGRKMSKRWGNVINPDDIISKYGADAMRLYEMFMGPFTQSIAWSTKGATGTYRFLEKVWKLQYKITNDQNKNEKLNSLIHKTIKKVGGDIENFRFNTAISALMILVNEMETQKEISATSYETLMILLAPFAPHIAEEIFQTVLGHTESIFLQKWPEFEEALTKDEEINLVLQVNGKVRDIVSVGADLSEEEAKKIALASDKIKNHIGDKEIKKIIFVKGKLVNIVI